MNTTNPNLFRKRYGRFNGGSANDASIFRSAGGGGRGKPRTDAPRDLGMVGIVSGTAEKLERFSDGVSWRMKPKTHLMQELCEFTTTNPSSNWCYRDEDSGGTMAAMARVRGGRGSARVVGTNLLRKFVARHPVPAIV